MIKKSLLVIVLILIVTTTLCTSKPAAGAGKLSNHLANEMINRYAEKQKEDAKLWKKEQLKHEKNPNYKPKSPQQIREQRKQKEKRSRIEYRKDIGFWKYYGSKLFGNWVKYLSNDPSIVPLNEIFFEDIMEAPPAKIDSLYRQLKAYTDPSLTNKRYALLEIFAADYKARTDTKPLQFYREFTTALQKANKSIYISPINPAQSGF